MQLYEGLLPFRNPFNENHTDFIEITIVLRDFSDLKYFINYMNTL